MHVNDDGDYDDDDDDENRTEDKTQEEWKTAYRCWEESTQRGKQTIVKEDAQSEKTKKRWERSASSKNGDVEVMIVYCMET